jgi:hypothetical protein
MDYQEIDELLNKYLEGETTLEEEVLLKDYFSQPDIDPKHFEWKEMFRFFAEGQKNSAPPFDTEAELKTVIEGEWKKETRNRFRRIIAWAGSAAAVLVLSFGLFNYLYKPKSPVKDTYTDSRLAYIETKRALMLVSKAMNRNTASLKYLSKVDESFNHLKKVAEIDKVVNSVKKD